MRTMITLDKDVAAKLKIETRRTGRPFKQIINDYLRLAFTQSQRFQEQEPFKVKAVPMGLKPGVSIDNIGEVLEQIDGSAHR